MTEPQNVRMACWSLSPGVFDISISGAKQRTTGLENVADRQSHLQPVVISGIWKTDLMRCMYR